MKKLRIAVSKGESLDERIDLLDSLGFDVRALKNLGRKLIITTSNAEFIIARSRDVPLLVYKNAVDCGICGVDSVIESTLDVKVLMELKSGKCMYAYALPEGGIGDYNRRLRIATEYPNITKRYFDSIGKEVEIVTMRGGVEIAPYCGISDGIIDIVITGETLKANKLRVVDCVLESTDSFITNIGSDNALLSNLVAELKKILLKSSKQKAAE